MLRNDVIRDDLGALFYRASEDGDVDVRDPFPFGFIAVYSRSRDLCKYKVSTHHNNSRDAIHYVPYMQVYIIRYRSSDA